MSHEFGPDDGPGPDTNHEPPNSTASEDRYTEHEVGEPTQVENDDIFADSDEEFSLIDPLFYAPLLLVGGALVAFPEPLTSVLGLLFIAAGLFLAVIDLLSPDEPA